MIRSFRERIAWYRAQQYLARYRPYGIVIAGTYGRAGVAAAIARALHRGRHIRNGKAVEHTIDIPENILGATSHREHGGIMSMLVGSKMRELTQFEPDTIITEVPLMEPEFAPWAVSRILPRMLVIPYIGLEHCDVFVNKDMILHEYLALTHQLGGDGVVIANADDSSIREILPNIPVPVITYGVHARADVRITRAVRGEHGTGIFLEITVHNERQELFLPKLFAKQHVSAIAAGIAAAHGVGISLRDALIGMSSIQPQEGHLSKHKNEHGITIIDDTYNTCPEQLESSVASFASFPSDGRKIVVLGDMDNLGRFSIHAHEEAGKHAAKITPIIIFVGDMMHGAQSAALQIGSKVDTHHFASSTDAAKWLPEHLRKGDTVFVTGGKSMKMKRIVARLKS